MKKRIISLVVAMIFALSLASVSVMATGTVDITTAAAEAVAGEAYTVAGTVTSGITSLVVIFALNTGDEAVDTLEGITGTTFTKNFIIPEAWLDEEVVVSVIAGGGASDSATFTVVDSVVLPEYIEQIDVDGLSTESAAYDVDVTNRAGYDALAAQIQKIKDFQDAVATQNEDPEAPELSLTALAALLSDLEARLADLNNMKPYVLTVTGADGVFAYEVAANSLYVDLFGAAPAYYVTTQSYDANNSAYAFQKPLAANSTTGASTGTIKISGTAYAQVQVVDGFGLEAKLLADAKSTNVR